MTAELAVTALRNAVVDRRPVATVVHSDPRSVQVQRVRTNVGENKLRGSLGRVGACPLSGQSGDNAAMESFFALVQNNVLDTRRWRTRAELRQAITVWIEKTYHRRRRQRRLGRHTPISVERLHTTAPQAA